MNAGTDGTGDGFAKRRVLLCVCGGIAAYKAVELVRRLRDAGAEVQVAMTASAQRFVDAQSFQAVSHRTVRHSLWDAAAEAAMGHLELARWADLVIVAPATANTIAKLAHGLADDLVSTVCLATDAPLAVAPAMNLVILSLTTVNPIAMLAHGVADGLVSTFCLATDAPLAVAPAMNHRMWLHPATQANIEPLRARGVQILGPDTGLLAEGESGPGRLREPEAIVADLAGRLAAPAR